MEAKVSKPQVSGKPELGREGCEVSPGRSSTSESLSLGAMEGGGGGPMVGAAAAPTSAGGVVGGGASGSAGNGAGGGSTSAVVNRMLAGSTGGASGGGGSMGGPPAAGAWQGDVMAENSSRLATAGHHASEVLLEGATTFAG